MPRPKRGYKRSIPTQELARDYKLFAIACEGSVREREYFSIFQHISSRIAVDIIGDVDEETGEIKITTKSSPKQVLERAVRYVENEGILASDELWLVLDIDRWPIDRLRALAEECSNHPNWHIALSNPCFEVWLYFHMRKDIDEREILSSSDCKHILAELSDGGYHPCEYILHVKDAIANAQSVDENPEYWKPEYKRTKVYLLMRNLMEFVSVKEFNAFIDNLPLLRRQGIEQL